MNIEQGGLENLILNALWTLEENEDFQNDVTKVQKEINKNEKQWAYTTVKTILDRLVEKGIVFRYKQKKFYYRARQSRQVSGENAIQKLVKQYFNNNIYEFKDTVDKIYSEMLVLYK